MKNKWPLERLLENLPEKLLAVAAAVVLFLFNQIDAMGERFISVPIRVITNQRLSPSEGYQKRVRVTLRGPDNETFPIKEEDVEVIADFSSFQNEGVFRTPLRVLRKGAAEEAERVEILVDPLEVTVTLEGKEVRNLDIEPSFTGNLPRGYEMTTWALEPSFVVAEGPRSRVTGVERVETESIDLRGRTGNFTTRVRLKNDDPLISFPLGSLIDFQGFVQETEISLSWRNIPVAGINLAPKLKLAQEIPNVLIQARGPQNFLETLDLRNIQIQVDFQHITAPGTYLFPLNPRVPLGMILESVSPSSLELEVVEND